MKQPGWIVGRSAANRSHQEKWRGSDIHTLTRCQSAPLIGLHTLPVIDCVLTAFQSVTSAALFIYSFQGCLTTKYKNKKNKSRRMGRAPPHLSLKAFEDRGHHLPDLLWGHGRTAFIGLVFSFCVVLSVCSPCSPVPRFQATISVCWRGRMPAKTD